MSKLKLDLGLDGSKLNEFIAQAILGSTLSEPIQKGINEAFNKVMTGYDSPIKKLVEKALHERITEKLKEPDNEKIIADYVGTLLVKGEFKRLIESALDRAMSAIKEYYR